MSDFFKAVVILCDYSIYENMKIRPKNHNDRFSILRKYFSDIYKDVSELFDTYTKSYVARLTKEDAEKLRKYAYGLKNKIFNKE